MKITEKKVKNNSMIIEIEMKYADYNDAVQGGLLDYRKKINMPGFRPGKAPMSIVKKKYELPLKIEEINKILSKSLQEHITKNKISIIGGPIPVDRAIDFEKENDYVFEYELGLQPDINLSKAEKTTVDYFIIDPSTKQINEHILNLRKRYGQIMHPEKITKEDMLNVSFIELDNKQPKKDGVNSQSSLLVDKISDSSLKEKFLKLKKSDKITIDIKKAFNNETDLSSMLNIPKEKISTIGSDFLCEIKTINRLVPADINEEFFKKIYPEKEIKSEKGLQKMVKEELSSMYIKESDRKLFNDASLIFLEKTKVDLPDLFLKKWLKSNAKKEFSDTEFETEYQNYLKYISWQLIENKICSDNNIRITNEALSDFTKQHVMQQMKSYGNVNMGDKEIDGIVSNILKNEQESKKMTNELVLIELANYFKSKMKIKKKTVSLDEFIKLANNQK